MASNDIDDDDILLFISEILKILISGFHIISTLSLIYIQYTYRCPAI